MKETERRQQTEPGYQFSTPLPEPRDTSGKKDPTEAQLGAEIGDIRPTGYVDNP